MKRYHKFFALLLVFLLIFCACGQSKDSISEGAEATVKAVLTCPNEELYSDAITMPIGLGVKLTEEQKAAIEAATQQTLDNWANAIGAYHTKEGLQQLINNGAQKYLVFADDGIPVELIDYTLTEKGEKYEIVTANIKLNGEELQVEFTFRTGDGDNGKFYRTEIREKAVDAK